MTSATLGRPSTGFRSLEGAKLIAQRAISHPPAHRDSLRLRITKGGPPRSS